MIIIFITKKMVVCQTAMFTMWEDVLSKAGFLTAQ